MAENDHFAIVDKPALLDSQNSKQGRGSVVELLEKKFGYAGLVHRLDFGTSGLMVCAKTATAARELTAELQAGRIKRTYLAVALGKILPNEGTLSTPIEGQEAVTHYKVLEHFANATLLEVVLETGRKHQIRRHLAEAGHPLLGDHLYGKGGSQRLFERPALHAHKLVVKGREYTAPTPEDLTRLIQRLKAIRS